MTIAILRGRKHVAQRELPGAASERGAADAGPTLPLQPSDRDVRLVSDMARHVLAKIVPVVDMHGRTMENAAQANVMTMEVALRLGLEAAQRTALTAVLMDGKPVGEALRLLDDTLELIRQGLSDHRDDLAGTVEAAHAGRAGGSVRP